MTDVDPITARKQHRTLEPFHGVVYFSAEAFEAYAAIGITDRQMGYFASRAAPMGPVPAEVVIATFFNFAPAEVHRWIPAAWSIATPTQVLDARLAGIDATLRRILGDEVLNGPEVAEAAALARTAVAAARPEGRALFAGHLSLPWPEPAHLQLWHALSLLREHRGDGHVACLVERDVSGCEALVLHGATGEVASAILQSTRARTDAEWGEAVVGLQQRGWLDADGALTEAGTAGRRSIEDRTDELAVAPWRHLGLDGCDRLRHLVRPLSRAIVESGSFGFGSDPAT
jgi:hypothetical protein